MSSILSRKPLILLLTVSAMGSPAALAARAPNAGDLLFTELAPAGTSNSYCEWFEMANLSGTELDLSTCFICNGSSIDGYECKPFTTISGDGSPLVPENRDLDRPALFARDVDSCNAGGEPCVGWSEGGAECIAAPTLFYSGDLTNSREQTACVLCGAVGDSCDKPTDGTVVAALDFFWDEYPGDSWSSEQYPGRVAIQNCSAEFEAHDRVEGPDWNLPPEDPDWPTVYYTPSSYDPKKKNVTWNLGLGSPGVGSDCPTYQNPGACEVIFTEVMAHPSATDSQEWVEITSLASGVRELDGCTINLYVFTEPDSGDTATFTGYALDTAYTFALGQPFDLQPDTPMILSLEHCTYSPGEGEPGDLCPTGEYVVDLGYNAFSAGKSYQIELTCPGAAKPVQVDMAGFWVDDALDYDMSSMLNPDASDLCSANDTQDGWCVASFQQEIVELRYEVDEEIIASFGTPGRFGGEGGVCMDNALPIPDGEEPFGINFLGCACGRAAAPRAGLLAGLGLLAALLIRRRSA